MDIAFQFLEEIERRCKANNIDTSDCYIMFARNQFWLGTTEVSGVAESKDGRWVCVPIRDSEDDYFLYGSCLYYPQCFEVKKKFETYLSDGYMSVLTTVWLLYR